MKKMLLLLLLFSALSANAQTDTTEVQTDSVEVQMIALPDSTAIGAPDGKSVSKEIGSAGGKIVSDDGRVELIFPAGALPANTNISIQPVTNMLNGPDKAYRLEPSGTQFKKPVQLIFHYTDEEAETCTPDLKSFALQDHKGKWSFFEYEDWDSLAKTLTGQIHHFSALITNQNNVLLRPANSKIGVNATTNIEVLNKSVLVRSGEFTGDYALAQFIETNNIGWFVNGEVNGNYLVGKAKSGIITAGFWVGEYEAPDKLPSENPVEVKMAFKYYSKKLKKKVWGSAKCKIEVFDAYKISIVHKTDFEEGMVSNLKDSASFTVFVYPNEILIDPLSIKNYPPEVTKQGTVGEGIAKMKEVIHINGGVQGSIHITEKIDNKKLSKDYTPEVYFEFEPKEIILCHLQYVSLKYGSGGPLRTMTYLSIPDKIKFIANGREQQYTLTTYKGYIYDLIVTPLRE